MSSQVRTPFGAHHGISAVTLVRKPHFLTKDYVVSPILK